MPWSDPSPLYLHHGTADIHAPSIMAGVDVTKGSLRRDFSRGFYTTTQYDQAVTHARNLAYRLKGLGAKQGVVFTFLVNRDAIGRLSSLVFLLSSRDYWDFVNSCRAGHPRHHANGYYDVVYGPVSESFARQTIHVGFDQISFHNNATAVGVLGRGQGRPVT